MPRPARGLPERMTPMTMLETVDGTEVREGVDRETIETVQAMAGKYKYG